MPKLGFQKNSLVTQKKESTSNFTITNIVEDSLQNLPYGPNEYGLIEPIANSGSPFRVVMQHGSVQNMPLSFQEQVQFTPVDYQEVVYLTPEGENREQYKKAFLTTADVLVQQYHREIWELYVKALHEYMQDMEVQQNQTQQKLTDNVQKEQQRAWYLSERQAVSQKLNTSKIALKLYLADERERILQGIEKKYSSSASFQTKGDCWQPINLFEGRFQVDLAATCIFETMQMDWATTNLKGDFKENYCEQYEKDHGTTRTCEEVLSDPIVEIMLINFDIANETAKKSKFKDAYTYGKEYTEKLETIPGLLDDIKAAQAQKQPTLKANWTDATKIEPAKTTQLTVETLGPVEFRSGLSSTISFLAHQPQGSRQGGFLTPVFLRDILENLEIGGLSFQTDPACNRQGWSEYLTTDDLKNVYQAVGDQYESPCDIAIDMSFVSFAPLLKYLSSSFNVNQDVLKDILLDEEIQNKYLSDLSKDGRNYVLVQQYKSAISEYKNKILPDISQHVSANRVNTDGSVVLSSRLNFKAQNFVNNVIGNMNFKPIFGENVEALNPLNENTWASDWLIWLIRNYQKRGLIAQQDLSFVENQIKVALDNKFLGVEIITPPRCDLDPDKLKFTADVNSGQVPNLGELVYAGSSENFAVDGMYTIQVVLYDDPIDPLAEPSRVLMKLSNIPFSELLGFSTQQLFDVNQVPLNLLLPETNAFGGSPYTGEWDPGVSVGITNKSGNTWSISVDKLGHSGEDNHVLNCDSAYQAACLPYNKSVFTLKHKNYRTGLYRLSAFYSKSKLSDEQKMGIQGLKWWDRGGDPETGRIYGLNQTGYGPKYAHDFLLLNPQYSTFARVSSAPRDFDFISRYSLGYTLDQASRGDMIGFKIYNDHNLLPILGNEQPKTLLAQGPTALNYTPNESEEKEAEPKAKIGVHEAYVVHQAQRNGSGQNSDLSLPAPLGNALIDLAAPQIQVGDVQSGSYGAFEKPQLLRDTTNKYVHVGAVVNLSSNHANIRASLFSASGHGDASVPMKLLLKSNGNLVKMWSFDAHIGTNTFVQRYWDGSGGSSKRNLEHPVYNAEDYEVEVQLDTDNWTEGYQNFLGQAYFKAKVHNPHFLNTSNQVQFQVKGGQEPSLVVEDVKVDSLGRYLISGIAPGLSTEEIKNLKPSFGNKINILDQSYAVNVGSRSNFIIRVDKYEYTEAFFSEYRYDAATDRFVLPPLDVTVSTYDLGFSGQQLNSLRLKTVFLYVPRPEPPALTEFNSLSDNNTLLGQTKNRAKRLLDKYMGYFPEGYMQQVFGQQTLTILGGFRRGIMEADTVDGVNFVAENFMAYIYTKIEIQATLESHFAYSEAIAQTVVDFAVEMYVPPNPVEHPYLFALDIAMTASGAKILNKGASAAIEAIEHSPSLAKAILSRLPSSARADFPQEILPCVVSFSTSSTAGYQKFGFSTAATNPCEDENVIRKIKGHLVEVVHKGTQLTVNYSNRIDNLFENAPDLATTIKNKLGAQNSYLLDVNPNNPVRPAAYFINTLTFKKVKSHYGDLRASLRKNPSKYRDLVKKVNRQKMSDKDVDALGDFLLNGAERSIRHAEGVGMKLNKNSGSPDFQDMSIISVDFSNIPELIKEYLISTGKKDAASFYDYKEGFALKFVGAAKDFKIANLLAIHQLIEKKVISPSYIPGTSEYWAYIEEVSKVIDALRKHEKGNALYLTWHHNEDLKTMQFLSDAVHGTNGHSGGERYAEYLIQYAGQISASTWSRFIGQPLSNIASYYF